MRITKEQLRQIIKEELEAVMSEQSPSGFRVFLEPGQAAKSQIMADALEELRRKGAEKGVDYEVEDGGIYIMDKSYADDVLDSLSIQRMREPDYYKFDMREA